MSARHDPSHERELARLVAEQGANAAIPTGDLAGCNTCAHKLDQLRQVVERLERAARADEAALAEAMRHAEPELERDVRHALREHLLGGAHARRRSLVPLLLAAVVLAALGWIWWRQSAPSSEAPGGPPIRMGTEHEGYWPVGEVGEFGTFRCPLPLPPGGFYVFRVFDAASPNGEPVVEETVSQPSWSPTAPLPDSIVWTVEVFDGSSNQPSERSARLHASRLR